MSPPKEKQDLASEDAKYLKHLPVMLEGTGKSKHDADVQLSPHFVIYKEDSPSGSFKAGDILTRCPSRWYAQQIARNFTRMGYTVAILKESDYAKRKKIEAQGAKKTR